MSSLPRKTAHYVCSAHDWAVLREMKDHNRRVNSVAVHHSGQVALSVGKDRMLYMWDLMRCTASASTEIGEEGVLVRWPTDMSIFCSDTEYHRYLLHGYGALAQHPSWSHDIKFCKRVEGEGEGEPLAGAEDEKLFAYVYDVPKDQTEPPTTAAKND